MLDSAPLLRGGDAFRRHWKMPLKMRVAIRAVAFQNHPKLVAQE